MPTLICYRCGARASRSFFIFHAAYHGRRELDPGEYIVSYGPVRQEQVPVCKKCQIMTFIRQLHNLDYLLHPSDAVEFCAAKTLHPGSWIITACESVRGTGKNYHSSPHAPLAGEIVILSSIANKRLIKSTAIANKAASDFLKGKRVLTELWPISLFILFALFLTACWLSAVAFGEFRGVSGLKRTLAGIGASLAFCTFFFRFFDVFSGMDKEW